MLMEGFSVLCRYQGLKSNGFNGGVPMQRVAFVMRVKEGQQEEYIRRVTFS